SALGQARQAAAGGLVQRRGSGGQGLVGEDAHHNAAGVGGRGGSVVQGEFQGHQRDSVSSSLQSDNPRPDPAPRIGQPAPSGAAWKHVAKIENESPSLKQATI